MGSRHSLLVLDACAMLHLKQLSNEAGDALELLDAPLEHGVGFASSRRVHGEQLEMSLSEQLGRWREAGAYEALGVRVSERKPLLNMLGDRRPMPGRKDLDLIVLAEREGAVLLTHDGPCAEAAAAVRVVSIDVIDLAALVVRLGSADWPRANELLAALDNFVWRPHDWSGSAEATFGGRHQGARLLTRLEAWLGKP